MTLNFRILGSLQVRDGDQPVALGGTKQRAVLALLLLHSREVVTTDRLIDELWGAKPPATAAKTVQVYISHLRKALGDGVLETHGRGYTLALEPGQLDLDRFEALVSEARAASSRGDVTGAATRFRDALDLWDGPPLADLAYEEFAQREIERLEQVRLAATEDWMDAELAAGHHVDAVPRLQELVRDNPLRERLRGQLMLALYRSGRQADALEAYQEARRTLVDELGIEPGRPLQELEGQILTQDPALDPPHAGRGLAAVAARVPAKWNTRLVVGGTGTVVAQVC